MGLTLLSTALPEKIQTHKKPQLVEMTLSDSRVAAIIYVSSAGSSQAFSHPSTILA